MKGKAFTVAEVLIVAIIIAVTIIILIPNIRGVYHRLQLEFLVQKIVAFCHNIQEEAITTSQRIILEIIADDNKLKVRLPDGKVKEFLIPKDYDLETDIWRAIFDGFGAILFLDPVKDGVKENGYILVKDKKGRHREILLYSTGSIYMKED